MSFAPPGLRGILTRIHSHGGVSPDEVGGRGLKSAGPPGLGKTVGRRRGAEGKRLEAEGSELKKRQRSRQSELSPRRGRKNLAHGVAASLPRHVPPGMGPCNARGLMAA
jgi:hypothetical protein